MRQILSAFLVGGLFGTGLIVSGMTNPAKVQNFLDLAGSWDPSLALVMAGALAVTFVGYRLVWRRAAPFGAPRFYVPDTSGITRELIAGSVLFGVGWGLAGLCPGPAVAVLPMAPLEGLVFLIGLIGGMFAHRFLSGRARRLAAQT